MEKTGKVKVFADFKCYFLSICPKVNAITRVEFVYETESGYS